ncbi:type VII secretion integral membrane protein EccD [Rhodococcus sp. NPDC057297]|uniref:type VII secretion integral membrane protein EccD n=1 Tax=Rhodococcus sp. NPDC057297 TaxID=3346090 RepID=UPI00362DBE85
MTGDLSQAVNGHGARLQPNSVEPSTRNDTRGLGVAAPLDLCRLTVLAKSAQVDMALPTDVPISLLIPGIVDIVDSRASAGNDRHGRDWVLSKVGMPPISGTATLNEASVRDGELLVLGTADAPALPPLHDDLMFAVASVDSSGDGSRDDLWTAATARRVGFVTSASAVLLACIAAMLPLLQLGGRVDAGQVDARSVTAAVAAATAAVLMIVAGTVVGRFYRGDSTGVFLSACALPLMFVAGSRFVPGEFGAPHLVLGGALVGASAVLALRIGGHGSAVFTAASAAAVTVCAGATVSMFTDLPVSTIGAGTTVVALAGLAAAPRVSMMQAGLPLPPVPTAGAPLDDAGDEDPTSAAELADRARRARSHLTGLVCAGGAAATGGALLAALGASDAFYRPGVSLALATALLLLLRGRTFAQVNHALPLVLGGASILLALVAAVVFTPALSDSDTIQLAVFVACVAVALVALFFGSSVPTREYSPVLRRTAELVEYAVIATVIPLACWVCGLYTAMRAL